MIEIEKALDLIEANIESCKTEIIPIEKSLNQVIAEKSQQNIHCQILIILQWTVTEFL